MREHIREQHEEPYACTHIFTGAWVFMCVCVRIYTLCAHIHLCMCVCVCEQYEETYACTHIFTSVWVFVCVCMCIHTSTWLIRYMQDFAADNFNKKLLHISALTCIHEHVHIQRWYVRFNNFSPNHTHAHKYTHIHTCICTHTNTNRYVHTYGAYMHKWYIPARSAGLAYPTIPAKRNSPSLFIYMHIFENKSCVYAHVCMLMCVMLMCVCSCEQKLSFILYVYTPRYAYIYIHIYIYIYIYISYARKTAIARSYSWLRTSFWGLLYVCVCMCMYVCMYVSHLKNIHELDPPLESTVAGNTRHCVTEESRCEWRRNADEQEDESGYYPSCLLQRTDGQTDRQTVRQTDR
jgi:hypothetical protein